MLGTKHVMYDVVLQHTLQQTTPPKPKESSVKVHYYYYYLTTLSQISAGLVHAWFNQM